MLKGQAKTDYQREYMRKRRGSNGGLTGQPKPLAGIDNTKHIIDLMKTLDGLDIEYIDADGYPVYDD